MLGHSVRILNTFPRSRFENLYKMLTILAYEKWEPTFLPVVDP